jgi:putative peptidoglycan lipid II flippase
MFVSFGAVGLNLLLNWLFTVRLGWGHQGLAFSTACIATTNFLLLYVLMHRHLGRLESRAMLSLLGRLSVACAVLAGICWAGDHYLLASWAVQRFWPKAGSLFAVILVGAGAFFFCATLLRIREMQDIVLAVQRKLHRRTA